MVTESSRLSHAEDKPFSLMEDWRGCAAGEHITWEMLATMFTKGHLPQMSAEKKFVHRTGFDIRDREESPL